MIDRLGQRGWLNEHWHAAWWLVFASLVVAAYVLVHEELRCWYIKDIRPQVKDAVRSYGLVSNPRTGVLELYAGDTAYDRKSEASGPLEIGHLPAARGVLNDAVSAIEDYNQGVRRYVEWLQSAFFRSPHNPHFMALVVPAPKNGGQEVVVSASKNRGQEVQYRLRVPADSYFRILQEYPNEKSLDVLIDLIARAEPVEVETGEEVESWTKEGRIAVDRFVTQMCRRREEMRVRVTALFGPNGTPSLASCDSMPGGCSPCEEAAHRLRGVPTKNRNGSERDPEAGSAQPDCTTEAKAKECGIEELPFHRELRKVVERGTGFFWTAGKLFWYEVMALAALGVLSRQLVLFAREYASAGGTGRVWRPRESLQTVMYIAVAPTFSLVIIWILTATEVVVVKPVIGEAWPNATVPIAFVLGLFPTLGYDVLRGLAEGLFGRSFLDSRVKAEPQEIPAVPADEPRARSASFSRLRRRIRDHATAVFR